MENKQNIVESVIDENEELVKSAKNGDNQALNKLVSKVISESDGEIGPNESEELVLEALSEIQSIDYPVELTTYLNIGGDVALLEKMASKISSQTPDFIEIDEGEYPDKVEQVQIEVNLLVEEPSEVHNSYGDDYTKSDIRITGIEEA